MPGVEKALEELLGGKAKPTELAHIDVRARLELAELTHFLDLPQLWPPTVAVCLDCLSLFVCVFRGDQVRELATRVRALLKNGEARPFIAVELKKCVGVSPAVFLAFVFRFRYLPTCCVQHVALAPTGEAREQEEKGTKSKVRGCGCFLRVVLVCSAGGVAILGVRAMACCMGQVCFGCSSC